MKNILLFFVSFICCSEEEITEGFLLESGYSYFICDELVYIENTFIIYNEDINVLTFNIKKKELS